MLKIITRQLVRQCQAIKTAKKGQEVALSKKKSLQKLAETVNIKLAPTIFDEDEDAPKPRILPQHKHQMGLFIPKSPFNTRLSRRSESHYLPSITKDLYLRQKEQLPSYLRILQNNTFLPQKRVTLDYYINLIYKDVYARYLISKGVGIEWSGYYSDVGVTNQFQTDQYPQDKQYKENYQLLQDFVYNQASNIRKSKTIGMYDYSGKRFVHSSQMEVESIKKMGYYVKEALTEFGEFNQQFSVLQEKNAKVYLLIFVEHLEKLIQPNAIVVTPDQDFYILKRFSQSPQDNFETEYLMLAKTIYNNHQKYFKSMNYQKHNLFNSKYLVGMQLKNIPIVAEIEGYERESGAYVVNSSCHLADFQRANARKLSHQDNFADDKGVVWLNNQNTGISLLDIKANKLLQDKLKQLYTFMDFFDVFDDELYYQKQTNKLLKFRLGDRYSIQLPYNASSNILEGLKREGTIIAESKIVMPGAVEGKKPKERRAFRKRKKELEKQLTEHYTLAQSLESINSVSVSSLSPSRYQLYLFLKHDTVVPFEQVLSQDEMGQLYETGLLSPDTLTRIQSQGYFVAVVNANDNLTTCLSYLKNLTSSKQVLNIIMEPQSQTYELIPYSLHLNYLINKKKGTRRRTEQPVKTNINLIKLHPTFQEATRELDVFRIIHGVVKSNQKQQYGMGFEALRLWTAKNDNYLGDREINEHQINSELKHGESIRKTFWQLLSLLPQAPHQRTDLTPQLYLSTFILDCLDCYISHMQQCYKYMNLHKAYEITLDFFENILEQIYVKSVRKHIINYPNHPENEEHFWVIRRIMELVAVIAPLFPFSAFHISRNQLLKWPAIHNPKFYDQLKAHNEMIRLRVSVVNKLRLNRLHHAHLHAETLKDSFSERDLELFFNIDKVTLQKPQAYKRQCSLRLPKHNKVTPQERITFYINDDHCLRCDSNSKQTQHFCSKCLSYMQEEIGQPFRYFELGHQTDTEKSSDVV